MTRQDDSSARQHGWISARAIVDVLYPPRCAVCGETPEQDVLCGLCAAAIQTARRATACPRCAAEVAPFALRNGRCPRCRRRRPHLAGVVRVGRYQDELADLLFLYKFGRQEHLGRLLGAWVFETVASAAWFPDLEGIVFVPSLWRRRIFRPYYAAERLAQEAARRSGLPVLPILRRIRGGPHQIGLSYRQRLDNVRGAFALARGVALNDARLLIVDDVMTTGATLNECAKVLRRSGAATVYAAVVLAVSADRTPQALRSF